MSITVNAKVQRNNTVKQAVSNYMQNNVVTVCKPAKAKGLTYFNITYRSKHKGKHNALGEWR